MKSFDSDLKKYSEKMRLKAAERSELRERILAYMEYHPLPKAPLKTNAHSYEKIESQHFIRVPLNTFYTRIFAGVFVLVLIVGIPFVAERSVPGDALYLVKTEINEGIQAQFANSPYEKIALETRLIERRISEARLLASEGKLTDEVEAMIAGTVKSHADAAQKQLAQLRIRDAGEAAIAGITFDSALAVQSAVLDTNVNFDAVPSVGDIKTVVRNAREETALERGTTTPSLEDLTARIELETTRAYELFEAIKGSATEDERKSIERRLADIERKISKATAAGDGAAEEKEERIQELITALSLTQKLISFMTDIDVRENVPLEDLVPIELTDEERSLIVSDSFESISKTKTIVEAKLPFVDDVNVEEKVSLGLEDLSTLMETASSSLREGNVVAAESTISRAAALVLDLEQLTKDVRIEEVQDTEVPDEEPTLETEEPATSTDPLLPEEEMENAGESEELEVSGDESEEETQEASDPLE